MQKKYYCTTKKSFYTGLIQASIISLLLSFLIVGFIVGSFTYNILFYIALFLCIFLISAFTLSPVSGYYTSIDDEAIVISSFKNVHSKMFLWDDIRAVSVGKVYNKYSRYNNSYYGVELLASNEFKNLTSTYKLSHLDNHDDLMDEIMALCALKDIKHIDLRSFQADDSI